MKKRNLILGVGLGLALIIPKSAFATEASVTNQTLSLNGNDISPAAYAIEGYNYFKLRDIAALFNGTNKQFDIEYKVENQSINIIPEKSYEKIDGDLSPLEVGNKEANPTIQSISVNNEVVNPKVYAVNGNNYFKIRDLGKYIGFYVGYDGAKNQIVIDTNRPYDISEEPKEEPKTDSSKPDVKPEVKLAEGTGTITTSSQKAAGVSLNIVNIPNTANFRYSVVKGNNALVGSQSFQSMINNFKPKAAINGNFFDAYKTLAPYSTIIKDGEVLQMIGSDPGFAVTSDGMKQVVSSVNAIYSAVNPNGAFHIWYKNQSPTRDSSGIYLFDRYYGNSVNLNGGSFAAVSDGVVIAADNANGAVNIPENGYVIYFGKDSGAVDYIGSKVPAGTKVDLNIVFSDPKLKGKKVEQLIAAGPLLVMDGEIAVEESLKNYGESKIHTQSTPRSAIGVKADGSVVLVTTKSATVRQLAKAMMEIGCVSATNLDGGASSGLYANGKTITAPGRNLNTVLMIFE